ncbi:DsrE family protein [Rhodopirellula sp. JC740]|uniref:DsrE family protein n=1 Tax=Rhodopirellula halodulae TaxID=2894198 RepID=A0ABS8NH74_9BACT|nr:DsrE family protein [Rhodopirellula sp. JC740]MCC9642904.1 DsrE family protein [Rhodopirellula sp. JC740]
MNTPLRFSILLLSTLLLSVPSAAQENTPGFRGGRGPGFGQGMGRGPRGGRGMGPGRAAGNESPRADNQHGHDERHDADHEVFQYLLQNHDKIKRTVKELPNGVETLTQSDVPDIADKIKEHVHWMEDRIENTNPIRMRDPLFAELFQHTDKIQMRHEETETGVRVIETSDDPYVADLIQAHAKVVSGFVERGFAEAMKNHAVPGKPDRDFKTTATPAIAGVGEIVRLPDAAQQPRPGTKLLVDLTRGADPNDVNPALKKLAKYLNIWAGAGEEPASLQLAVVFHGDATLVVLEPGAYAANFQTDDNPNLSLLRQLHEAGVDMYVCGQSLISSGGQPDEVVVFVETAVSAVTSVANLQADGFAYLPLGN